MFSTVATVLFYSPCVLRVFSAFFYLLFFSEVAVHLISIYSIQIKKDITSFCLLILVGFMFTRIININ